MFDRVRGVLPVPYGEVSPCPNRRLCLQNQPAHLAPSFRACCSRPLSCTAQGTYPMIPFIQVVPCALAVWLLAANGC